MGNRFGRLAALLALVLAIGAVLAWSGLIVRSGDGADSLADKELRAAYVPYPPSLIVDPNTGQFSGISYDTLAAISDKAGVKLVMGEEVAWGTMIENLKTGRSEIIATGIWPTDERRAQADFSNPIFYSPVYAYVRADDKRFDGALARVNNSRIKVAILDGEVAETIAKEDFPKAQHLSLPQLSQVSELLLNVQNGKADITFVEPAVADAFLAANPGSIRRLEGIPPVRAFPTCFMVPKGQKSLLDRLNAELAKLQADGTIGRILDRYEEKKGTFIRVADYVPSTN